MRLSARQASRCSGGLGTPVHCPIRALQGRGMLYPLHSSLPSICFMWSFSLYHSISIFNFSFALSVSPGVIGMSIYMFSLFFLPGCSTWIFDDYNVFLCNLRVFCSKESQETSVVLSLHLYFCLCIDSHTILSVFFLLLFVLDSFLTFHIHVLDKREMERHV